MARTYTDSYLFSDLVRLDVRHHVAGPAVHRDVVARAQLVGVCPPGLQVGLLDGLEGGAGVVGEAADVVASVAKVVGVAPSKV